MKKEPKVRWTAKVYAPLHEAGRVGINITVHNLAELGFKEALKEFGEEYSNDFDIPVERYLAMSEEDKRRLYENFIQEMLKRVTRVENRYKQVEETARMISEEVVTGETTVSEAEEEKPLKIVDKESVQKIVTEAKKLVYESPDMQKVLILKELLTVAENYSLDEKWISTAGYLLIEEIALKRWFLQHEHNEQSLKNKDYKKLLDMLETDFKRMGRPISPRDLSRFLGERLFRNRVLHEGYNPTSSEAKETKEMAISLLEFLKQH